jgi:hypothetical protein
LREISINIEKRKMRPKSDTPLSPTLALQVKVIETPGLTCLDTSTPSGPLLVGDELVRPPEEYPRWQVPAQLAADAARHHNQLKGKIHQAGGHVAGRTANQESRTAS